MKMKTLIGTSLLTAALVVPAFGQIGVYIGTPPPPLRYETRPPFPGEGYQWVEGYWQPNGGRYRWVGGHWDRPPYAGAYWSHPHYDHYENGWQLHEGHWDHDDHGDHHDWGHDHDRDHDRH